MREKGSPENDLFDRLAADGRLGLSRADIDTLVADRSAFVGAAQAQVAAVTRRITDGGDGPPGGGHLQPAPHPLTSKPHPTPPTPPRRVDHEVIAVDTPMRRAITS